MNEEDKTISQLLDELSFLSRETTGASFVIQHQKDDGRYKVVFNNAMVQMKNSNHMFQPTDFKKCLSNAIEWLRNNRKNIEVPVEKYTLY